MNDTVIELKGTWKIFGERADEAMEAVKRDGMGKSEVLEKFSAVVGIADVSFSVGRGEIFCIMGLSGSGKSTLVRHVNRLIEPTAGEISILGEDVMKLSDTALRKCAPERSGWYFSTWRCFPTDRYATT